ncbi:MAG: efflux RND transporter periplasmic adaptor subunit [Odoribacteraceae bacterium]|jgi:RND family efflux transporter MFP subunit|nr:efflux RND transporter periplasmic adaptor subunit [Odoribacteraceae bacterium]
MIVKNSLLTIMAGAMLAGCAGKKTETSREANESKAIPVKVMTLETRNIARSLDYTASLEADEQLYYAPASPGRIQKIHVEIGDRVRKGQLLVEMDKTQLAQAEVQFQNLEIEYRRAQQLNESKSISRQAYDAAVTQYEVAQTNLAFLRENTRLLAPFDGVITGKFFEDGEMYSGTPAGGAPKASILSIEKINPLKAYVNMTEQYYPMLQEGTRVELKTNLYPGRVYPGKVSIVYPTIDKNSRTFTVEVTIPNDDRSLRPGMFGTINFFVGASGAIIVPALAVLKLQGSNIRYLFLNDNGKARRVEVTLGKRFDDQVEIISDEIKPGDQLVTVGQARLVDGAALDIQR